MDEMVLRYLRQLREPKSEDAYFALLELDDAQIPDLIEAYHQETNIRAKSALVEIIWKHASYDSLDFLRTAFHDDHEEVWKAALDGIVARGGADSIEILENEKKHLSADPFQASSRLEWIDEAIEQIKQSK